jgi:hypothetical protein
MNLYILCSRCGYKKGSTEFKFSSDKVYVIFKCNCCGRSETIDHALPTDRGVK